jgi:hypothetical protein
MPKLLAYSGAGSIVLFASNHVVGYCEGLLFVKFFFWPLVSLPLVLIGSLALLVAIPATIYRVIKGKTPAKWGAIAAAIPFAIYFTFALPGFSEGMRHAVRNRLAPDELYSFAEDARAEAIDWKGRGRRATDHDAKLAVLRPKHQNVFSISEYEPRVSTGKNELVEIFYGGPLAGHWGIVITESCPREHLDCLKVYQGVWVYYDTY